MTWKEQQAAVGKHFPHRWKLGAWGPCVNRDPSGHDIAGRYAYCDCGAMCFVGERSSTGEAVAVLWPATPPGGRGESIDVPVETLR